MSPARAMGVVVLVGAVYALGVALPAIGRWLERPDRVPSRRRDDIYGDVPGRPQDYNHLPRLPLRKRL